MISKSNTLTSYIKRYCRSRISSKPSRRWIPDGGLDRSGNWPGPVGLAPLTRAPSSFIIANLWSMTSTTCGCQQYHRSDGCYVRPFDLAYGFLPIQRFPRQLLFCFSACGRHCTGASCYFGRGFSCVFYVAFVISCRDTECQEIEEYIML